jgi:hypothetical protein
MNESDDMKFLRLYFYILLLLIDVGLAKDRWLIQVYEDPSISKDIQKVDQIIKLIKKFKYDEDVYKIEYLNSKVKDQLLAYRCDLECSLNVAKSSNAKFLVFVSFISPLYHKHGWHVELYHAESQGIIFEGFLSESQNIFQIFDQYKTQKNKKQLYHLVFSGPLQDVSFIFLDEKLVIPESFEHGKIITSETKPRSIEFEIKKEMRSFPLITNQSVIQVKDELISYLEEKKIEKLKKKKIECQTPACEGKVLIQTNMSVSEIWIDDVYSGVLTAHDGKGVIFTKAGVHKIEVKSEKDAVSRYILIEENEENTELEKSPLKSSKVKVYFDSYPLKIDQIEVEQKQEYFLSVGYHLIEYQNHQCDHEHTWIYVSDQEQENQFFKKPCLLENVKKTKLNCMELKEANVVTDIKNGDQSAICSTVDKTTTQSKKLNSWILDDQINLYFPHSKLSKSLNDQRDQNRFTKTIMYSSYVISALSFLMATGLYTSALLDSSKMDDLVSLWKKEESFLKTTQYADQIYLLDKSAHDDQNLALIFAANGIVFALLGYWTGSKLTPVQIKNFIPSSTIDSSIGIKASFNSLSLHYDW